MTLENVKRVMLTALFIPVAISMALQPAVNKFFMEMASVEVISTANMISQGLVMFVAFVGCTEIGLKIFIRAYYPMWVLIICIDIIIAITGMEQVEIRFFLNAVQASLGLAVVSQSLNHYCVQVINGTPLQLFINQQRAVTGIAGILGSFLAFMLGDINIQTALWINVLFGFISFGINTFVLVQFKRLASENKNEKG